MVMEEEVGVAAAATKEDAPGMMETATIKVAEVTAVGASTTAIATKVVARGMDVRIPPAEARGIKSPRTVLRHHHPVRAEAAAKAKGQGLTPPMAEKSAMHEIG